MPGCATIVKRYISKKPSKSFKCRLSGQKFKRTFERRPPRMYEYYEERSGEEIAHRADRRYYHMKFWILKKDQTNDAVS